MFGVPGVKSFVYRLCQQLLLLLHMQFVAPQSIVSEAVSAADNAAGARKVNLTT